MRSLIANLITDNFLKSPEIIFTFQKINRRDFVLPEYLEVSNLNIPLPIGYGQTISQPATVAFMLELIKPKIGEKILDIGSGSGWTTALLAELVGPEGRVYGIERILSLKNFGEKNIEKYGFIKAGRVKLFCQDGHQGLSKHAPFDKILVSAAATELPNALLQQLAINGRLIIPIGNEGEEQSIVSVERIEENNFQEKIYPGFSFVPLVKN